MTRRVLFLTWDGPGTNYLSSLFLPIFSALRPRGYAFSILQHTFAAEHTIAAEARAAAEHSIPYLAERVPDAWRKLALPLLVALGGRALARRARETNTQLICARSIIPAAMALVALKLDGSLKLVFDADGLMADERVDFAGLSPHSPGYRVLRDLEAEALRAASSVITRTEKARAILAARAGAGTDDTKIYAVPNGKDASRFMPRSLDHVRKVRTEHGVPESAPWLVYVGSLGPQYHPELMLRFTRELQRRRPDTHLSLFTFSESTAKALLERDRTANVQVRELAQERVADVLAAADLGMAFRTTSFSQRAVCPIKVGEYLLSGVPVVATKVGDLQTQLAGCDGAYVLPDLDEASLTGAAEWFVESALSDPEPCKRACRRAGLEHFALERCIDGYVKALTHAER